LAFPVNTHREVYISKFKGCEISINHNDVARLSKLAETTINQQRSILSQEDPKDQDAEEAAADADVIDTTTAHVKEKTTVVKIRFSKSRVLSHTSSQEPCSK